MKKLMVLIAVTGFVFLSFNITAFAWDPSGSWGIEGRTDATIKISCTDDTCKLDSQSAYSKAKATGYLLGDKLALAYNIYSDKRICFVLFENRGDGKMLSKTFELDGKNVGEYKYVRK